MQQIEFNVGDTVSIDKFRCPFCKQRSIYRYTNLKDLSDDAYVVRCGACVRGSIWIQAPDSKKGKNRTFNLVYPLVSVVDEPNPDMPEDVKVEYREASLVVVHSPKAAAALMRLALEKLLRSFEKSSCSLSSVIQKLERSQRISKKSAQLADILRITGNNAVHPGVMTLEDIEEVCTGLFVLLNRLVEELISIPKRDQELIKKLPEGQQRKLLERMEEDEASAIG